MQPFHFIHWSTSAKQKQNYFSESSDIEKQARGFAAQPKTKEILLLWDVLCEANLPVNGICSDLGRYVRS